MGIFNTSTGAAFGRHVLTYTMGAVTAASALHLVSASDAANLTTAINSIANGLTTIAGAAATVVAIFSGLYASWTATDKSRMASVAAMPEVKKILVNDPILAAATPSAKVTTNSSAWVGIAALVVAAISLAGCSSSGSFGGNGNFLAAAVRATLAPSSPAIPPQPSDWRIDAACELIGVADGYVVKIGGTLANPTGKISRSVLLAEANAMTVVNNLCTSRPTDIAGALRSLWAIYWQVQANATLQPAKAI